MGFDVLGWLGDIGNGNSILGGPMGEAGDTSSMVMPKPMSAPMPPVQQTGADVSPPVPDPSTTDIGAGMQGGSLPPVPDPSVTDIGGGMQGAGPPQPPVPLPRPRPAAADAAPAAPPIPPNAAPTGGQGLPLPPNTPPALLNPPPVAGAGGGQPQALGILGRALGLDPNREAQIRGSLGAGLKSVGDNWNKPGLAAFSGSAGAGIEGGKAATDKTTDQQDRFLGRQISAKNADNAALNGASTRTLNAARTEQALADAKYKMTGGKDSVLNSTQQLYLRGAAAAAADPSVKASAATLKQIETQFGVDSKEAKQARETHNQLISDTRKRVLGTLGVDEKTAEKLGKMPGMSQDNPIPKEGLTQEKFDKLPPGSWFINPKDGRVLKKKDASGANPSAAPQSAPGQGAAAAPSQMTPSVPPTPPAAAKVASAPASNDDEED